MSVNLFTWTYLSNCALSRVGNAECDLRDTLKKNTSPRGRWLTRDPPWHISSQGSRCPKSTSRRAFSQKKLHSYGNLPGCHNSWYQWVSTFGLMNFADEILLTNSSGNCSKRFLLKIDSGWLINHSQFLIMSCWFTLDYCQNWSDMFDD